MSLLVKIPEKPKTTRISFEAPAEMDTRLKAAVKAAHQLGYRIDLDEALNAAFVRIVRKIEKEVGQKENPGAAPKGWEQAETAVGDG